MKFQSMEQVIAFAEWAEGHAFALYTIYAGILRDAGYIEGAMKLEELAANEKEHMERWVVKRGDSTDPNAIMQKVVNLEINDSQDMYTSLLKLAEMEKASNDIIEMVQHLIEIENRHAIIINDLKSIYEGKATSAQIEAKRKGKWVCPHCGNFYYSQDEIPEKCPVCEHSRDDYVWMEE